MMMMMVVVRSECGVCCGDSKDDSKSSGIDKR